MNIEMIKYNCRLILDSDIDKRTQTMARNHIREEMCVRKVPCDIFVRVGKKEVCLTENFKEQMV